MGSSKDPHRGAEEYCPDHDGPQMGGIVGCLRDAGRDVKSRHDRKSCEGCRKSDRLRTGTAFTDDRHSLCATLKWVSNDAPGNNSENPDALADDGC